MLPKSIWTLGECKKLKNFIAPYSPFLKMRISPIKKYLYRKKVREKERKKERKKEKERKHESKSLHNVKLVRSALFGHWWLNYPLMWFIERNAITFNIFTHNIIKFSLRKTRLVVVNLFQKAMNKWTTNGQDFGLVFQAWWCLSDKWSMLFL